MNYQSTVKFDLFVGNTSYQYGGINCWSTIMERQIDIYSIN